MSNYAQSTFFTPKDGLTPGDPLKIIKGSDVDPELSAISTAIATKLDTAGAGIAIATTTVGLDFSALTDVVPAAGDEFVFGDISDADNIKRAAFSVIEATLNHDSLAGYVANEHVAHSSVSITTGTNSGLTGGGTISATRSLSVDIAGTALHAGLDAANDLILVYDASGTALKRATIDDAFSAVGGTVPDSRNLTAGAGMTGGGTLSADRTFDVVGGVGITANANDIALDINGLTSAVATLSDSIAIYDASASGVRKESLTDIKALVKPATTTTTATGVIELATQTEVDTGTDTVRAVTPSTLANYVNLGTQTQIETNGVTQWDFTNQGTAQTVTELTVTIDDAAANYLFELDWLIDSTTGGYDISIDPPAADAIHYGMSNVDGAAWVQESSTGAAFSVGTKASGSSVLDGGQARMFIEPSVTGTIIVTVNQSTADLNSSKIVFAKARLTKLDDSN